MTGREVVATAANFPRIHGRILTAERTLRSKWEFNPRNGKLCETGQVEEWDVVLASHFLAQEEIDMLYQAGFNALQFEYQTTFSGWMGHGEQTIRIQAIRNLPPGE